MSFTERVKIEVRRRSACRCCICHKPFIEIHHIVPKSEGGSDDIKNAAPLCAGCHDIYGGNPMKRKQIKELRDMWYLEIEKKRNGSLEKLFEEYQEVDNRLQMSGDAEKAIAIYHKVFEYENFETSAKMLFDLVKNAQNKFPNKRRILYLDIEGHRNKKGGFDVDMFELQKEFLLDFLIEYLYEANIPFGVVRNENQNNNLPVKLIIKGNTKC